MKSLKKLIPLLFAVCALLALFGCQSGSDDPQKPTPVDTSNVYVMVAAYENNAYVDGKPIIDAAGKYALVKYGEEISAENIIMCGASFDASNFVGFPAQYKIVDEKITDAMQVGESIKYESFHFERDENGGYKLYTGAEVKLADALKASPSKYWLALDGLTFKSGSYDGQYGLANKCDDFITLYDIDGDGAYDYGVFTPVYNNVEVVSMDGTKAIFKGGYGSSCDLDIFKNQTQVTFKKPLAMKNFAVGDKLNVTVRLNGTEPLVTVDSTATTLTAEFTALIFNNPKDITARAAELMFWTDAMSDAEIADMSLSGRNLMTSENLGLAFKFVKDKAGYVVAAEPADKSDINYASLPGYEVLATSTGTEAVGLLDVQSGWHGQYTYTKLKTRINMLHKMGIRKVYVVTCNPGFPMFSWARCGYSARTFLESNIITFKYLGFEHPDHAIAKACHELGMECIAVYKPYEGGSITTAPTGAKIEDEVTGFQDIFGIRYLLDEFIVKTLSEGKDYRICRRPDGINDDLEGNVDRIVIDFVAESFQRRNNGNLRGQTQTVTPINDAQIKSIVNGVKYSNKKMHPTNGINLWVSADNSRYELYQGDYTYEYVLDTKVLYDLNGRAMLNGKATKVISLVITGISIPEHFCAVSFVSTENLATDPLAFCHIYSGNKEIVSTATNYARNPYTTAEGMEPEDYVWGRDYCPAKASYVTGISVDKDGVITVTPTDGTYKDQDLADRAVYALARFNLYGFEFNFESYPEYIAGGNSVIAIGRGRTERLPGGLCEGYEEVRNYWLSHVEDLCKGGFDGVLIRLQAHSSIATDYMNFGFNEPIIEKYKELYGEEAYNTILDPNHTVTDEEYIRIMRIRGDYFALFYEEAGKICHKYGATIGVTLREAYVDPIVSGVQNEVCWWTMPKVVLDWQKMVDLSDHIVIKDYVFNTKSVVDNAKTIKEYAKAQNKKVTIELYDEQASMFTKGAFVAASNDRLTDGIMLYELSNIEKYYSTGLEDLLKSSGFEVKKASER